MASPRLSPLTATVHEIDPISDPRWPRFLARHPRSSAFHSTEWLDALKRTYGYAPVVLTTSGPGSELTNGLVFCRIESWFTGRRMVSVPFSDHCVPLVRNDAELALLLSKVKRECDIGQGMYLELRTLEGMNVPAGFSSSCRYALHILDLRPSLEALFQRLHPNCIRRKILRARREGFRCEEVQSERQLREFYRLAIMTRRRQQLPPQPLAWFQNLIHCLGDKLKIRLLFRAGHAVAGILTIRFQNTITYKYGYSDKRHQRFGCMPLLLWLAIEEAKGLGLLELDLGRSDWDNEGLSTFKERWGAARSTLLYLRYPDAKPGRCSRLLHSSLARSLSAFAPDGLLAAAGKRLYRHMG